MNNRYKIILKNYMNIFLKLLFAFLIVFPSYSQIPDAASMRPILSDATHYIMYLENNNYEIVRLEFDILKETSSTYRWLQSDFEYGVLAFGDYRILDIDILIYKEVDGNWVLIKNDTDAKSNALVYIKPSETGFYKIDIVPFKIAEGYPGGHYGMIFFHK